MSTWFSRSGASPPSFHPSPLISARIGVSPLFRIFSQTGDRVSNQIRSFNFQSVPNGECIRVPAARCICTTAIQQTTAGRGAFPEQAGTRWIGSSAEESTEFDVVEQDESDGAAFRAEMAAKGTK